MQMPKNKKIFLFSYNFFENLKLDWLFIEIYFANPDTEYGNAIGHMVCPTFLI